MKANYCAYGGFGSVHLEEKRVFKYFWVTQMHKLNIGNAFMAPNKYLALFSVVMRETYLSIHTIIWQFWSNGSE